MDKEDKERRERNYVICVKKRCNNWSERKKKGLGNVRMIKCNLNYDKGRMIDIKEGINVRDGGRKKANKNPSYFYAQLFEQIIIFVTVRANRCRRGSFVFDNG